MAKFKIGDKLICKAGFDSNNRNGDKIYGGAGYIENLEMIVNEIGDGRDTLYWGSEAIDGGVYEYALELVNEDSKETNEPILDVHILKAKQLMEDISNIK